MHGLLLCHQGGQPRLGSLEEVLVRLGRAMCPSTVRSLTGFQDATDMLHRACAAPAQESPKHEAGSH